MHRSADTSAGGSGPAWAVVVPGLETLVDLAGVIVAPNLGRLLARAVRSPTQDQGIHAAIAREITGQKDGLRVFPPGPVCAALDLEEAPPAGVLRIDPAHLVPTGDGLVMADVGELGPEVAEAFAAVIGDALGNEPRPIVGAARRWYAGIEGLEATDWTAPELAMGRDVLEALPRGPAGGELKRLLNEIQMILHEHPLNQARGRAGLPELNSVWIWGWARGAARVPPRWSGVCYGDHAYARALCQLAGGRSESSHRATPAIDDLSDAGLVIGTGPADALARGDGEAAIDGLRDLDRNWFRPLLKALRRRRLRRLRLVSDRFEYGLGCADAWKIWRRCPPAGNGE